MPSSVEQLLAAVDLNPSGCVRWGERVPETKTGVYVVALTRSAEQVDCTLEECPLGESALDDLIAACPDLRIDGGEPDRKKLAERLSAYWLADECVLYIGLAGQPLRARVRQYYNTPLGAAKPHKGGWWLKTLSVLPKLWVHFAATDAYEEAETDMLRAFAAGVSDVARRALPADDPIMPYANLRDDNWRRKKHGITGATAETSGATGASKTRRRAPQMATAPAEATPTVTPPRRSQQVTAKDIESGQIRIPRGLTKSILPRDRQTITVVLRGHTVTCHWDPRYGPPERSGVIRVGRAVARELLEPGGVLAVTANGDQVQLT
jgi:hypothetical protein